MVNQAFLFNYNLGEKVIENLLNSKIDKYINYQISQNSHFNQSELKRLEKLRDLSLQKQFIDAISRLSESDYNKWLKSAKKTFLLSIPTESLLMGDIHDYRKHSIEELNESIIGNLSSNQIIAILDSLDIYTIMKLITDNVYIEEVERSIYTESLGNIKLVGETENGKLYAFPNRKFTRSCNSVVVRRNKLGFFYYHRGGIKSINDISAYEVLYRFLKLPIATVLSSINEINTNFSCDIPYNDELCAKLERIKEKPSISKTLVSKRR